MITKPFILATCLLLISCSSDSKTKQKETSDIGSDSDKKSESAIVLRDLKENENVTWKKWFSYYEKANPNFSLEDFVFVGKSNFSETRASVFGSFDKEFNEKHADLLVYNSSKTQYIDFDSYNLGFDEDGTAWTQGEQEIVLVDLTTKKVARIDFRGLFSWVEDAFWLNDSFVVLLENNMDKKPSITFLDLEKHESRSFSYKTPIENAEEYSELRLESFGIKTE